MEKGQIAEQGSPSQIVDSPASQRLADFLGSAQV
jgi:ABC-type histidine transport system ATPase subunit